MRGLDINCALAADIRRQITRALCDFNMLEKDDRVLVAVSGGKDSTILALLLDEIRRRAPFTFTITPVLIDMGQPGFFTDEYAAFLHDNGLPLVIHHEMMYPLVKEKTAQSKSLCPLCSRFRRGILYSYAKTHGFNKIALGHHRDDLIETLLMNIFYEGRIAAMPPALRADDGGNIVVRPMCYVAQNNLVRLSHEWDIPVVNCGACQKDQGPVREKMRGLIDSLEKDFPGTRSSMLASLSNIRVSQMLDRSLWDFSDFHRK